MLQQDLFRPHNGAGWRLELHRFSSPSALDRARPPILMIPGYGMNSFILNFHPTDQSMVEFLCRAGFEVWTANLRGQGGSQPTTGSRHYGFRELSLIDLPHAISLVLDETSSRAHNLHGVGCSLGASIFYAYLAHHPQNHKLASLIALGGPLRWDSAHPLLRLAFSSSTIAGLIPIKGTRRAARNLLPILKRAPRLLSLYMNASQIDLSQASELAKTVDDPNPYLNRQIAHWIRQRDLVVAGVNITHALNDVHGLPVLCLTANRDGIVPKSAAMSIAQVIDHVDSLTVGDARDWYAHADLFIADSARSRVFSPMADWLSRHTAS